MWREETRGPFVAIARSRPYAPLESKLAPTSAFVSAPMAQDTPTEEEVVNFEFSQNAPGVFRSRWRKLSLLRQLRQSLALKHKAGTTQPRSN